MMNYAMTISTGYHGLPNVYVGTAHIGGYNDLKSYMHDSLTFYLLLQEQQIDTALPKLQAAH